LLRPGVSLGLHGAEIEALRGEFTDAVLMRGYDRVASRFTPDSALRMPDTPVGLPDREEIRARGELHEFTLVDGTPVRSRYAHSPRSTGASGTPMMAASR
jgi:hypothetical protein